MRKHLKWFLVIFFLLLSLIMGSWTMQTIMLFVAFCELPTMLAFTITLI